MVALEELFPAYQLARQRLMRSFHLKDIFVLGFIVLVMGGLAVFLSFPVLLTGWVAPLGEVATQWELGNLTVDFREGFYKVFEEYLGLLLMVLAGVAALWFVLVWISSIFKFIFFEAVLEDDFNWRDSFRKHLKKCSVFFIFMGGLNLFFITACFYAMIPFLQIVLQTEERGMPFYPIFLCSVAIFFLRSLATDFIIPLSIERNQGLWTAFLELLFLISERFKEFVVYEIMRFTLGCLGILAAGILFIPLGLIGLAGAGILLLFFLGLANILFIASAAKIIFCLMVMVPLGLLFFLYILALAYMPVAVFLRCYSVKMLRRCQQRPMSISPLLY